MRFVVLGGGCYGTFYTRQLLRASDAGALDVTQIVVVDHGASPQCAPLFDDARVAHARAEWDEFFDEYLEQLPADATDQIVPPPFTPHLALAWLLRVLPRDVPQAAWSLEPFGTMPGTPFEHQGEGGPLVVSHAAWMCPVHCIEPGICPHTREQRTWDVAQTVEIFTAAMRPRQPVSSKHLFQCLHLAYGVGTFPAAAIVKARETIRASVRSRAGEQRFLVGTVSHCHGALNLLRAVTGMEHEANSNISGHDARSGHFHHPSQT